MTDVALSAQSNVTGKSIAPVQYLRGIAAMMVAWFHVGADARSTFGAQYFSFGEFGVDIFFVISGFVMVVSTRTGTSPKTFLLKRLIRIVPMYWFFTIAMVAGVALAPAVFRSAVLTSWHVIASLAFIPHYSPSLANAILPVLVPGWTLNYELFFYLVFALLLGLTPAKRSITIGLLFLFGVACFRVLGAPDHPAFVPFYANPLIFEFAFGMFVAVAYQRGICFPPVLALPASLLALAFLCIFATPGTRLLTAGVPAIVLVWSCLTWRGVTGLAARVLASIGDASYSIYLGNIFVIGLWRIAFKVFPHALASPVVLCIYCLLATASCAVVGVLAYRMVELPMTKSLRKLLFAPKLKQSESA